MTGEFRALSLGSLAVILVALGAWAAFFGPDAGEDAVDDAEATESGPTADVGTAGILIEADGPLIRWVSGPGTEGMAAQMGGPLTLEDGCLSFGDSNVIVWPAGTAWDDHDEVVVLDDGTRVSLGDQVLAGGGAGGMMRDGATDEAWAVAERCVADLSDDAERVAWLNNFPGEISVAN